MPRETGKSKAQRIQMDYYRSPSRLRTFRRMLTALALLTTCGYAVVAYFAETSAPSPSTSMFSRWWAAQISTGPVAEVHAAFENDCARCHGSGSRVPLANDAWRGGDAAHIIGQIGNSCTAAECHQVHHHFSAEVTPAARLKEKNCVLCHREHLGRYHDMVAVSDQSCASCHQDLRSTCQGKTRLADPQITSFFHDHNEFRSLARDTGSIKFNHYQHLQPGQVQPSEDGSAHRGGFRLSMLSEKFRSSYRASGSDPKLVQLECDDCHSFRATSDQLAQQVADGSLSQYATPIRFELHCEACHALSYGGQTGPMLPLPHAAPGPEVALLLRCKIEGGRLAGLIRMPSDEIRNIPVPRKSSAEAGSDYRIGEEEIDQRLDDLALRCQQCHDPAHLTEEYIATSGAPTTASLIPERWLLSGSFNHVAHAKMDCLFCHAQATERTEVEDHRTVMIDGIHSCRLCHRPAESPTPQELLTGTLQSYLRFGNHAATIDASEDLTASAHSTLSRSQPTWASDRCVYCHQYHWTRP